MNPHFQSPYMRDPQATLKLRYTRMIDLQPLLEFLVSHDSIRPSSNQILADMLSQWWT
jgi:hypothetical protein